MTKNARLTGPSTLTVALLAGLATVTAVGYRLVPATVRVHWSLGGPYYGPEVLPKLPALLAVPATAVAVVGLLLALPQVGLVPPAVARSRPYRLAVVGTTAVLAVGQVALVAANSPLA